MQSIMNIQGFSIDKLFSIADLLDSSLYKFLLSLMFGRLSCTFKPIPEKIPLSHMSS